MAQRGIEFPSGQYLIDPAEQIFVSSSTHRSYVNYGITRPIRALFLTNCQPQRGDIIGRRLDRAQIIHYKSG
uniref:CN hydrolase domain-containing protein n=1 Tax=Steinernema glaseri TaxID=37863 RepID=A0A1I7ZIV1_9BILA